MRIPGWSAILLASSLACVSPKTTVGGFDWDAYEVALHRHAMHPERASGYAQTLHRLLQEAEARGHVPPSGLCAEYGYLLLLEGQAAEALRWFEKEKAHWPESTAFVDRLVARARGRAS